MLMMHPMLPFKCSFEYWRALLQEKMNQRWQEAFEDENPLEHALFETLPIEEKVFFFFIHIICWHPPFN